MPEQVQQRLTWRVDQLLQEQQRLADDPLDHAEAAAAFAGAVAEVLAEVFDHEPFGVVVRKQRHQQVGADQHPSAAPDDQHQRHRPASAVPDQHPEADGHEQNARVLSDQWDQQSGGRDQPSASLEHAQHQSEDGQGQLAQIGEVAECWPDQGVAGEVAVADPVGGAFRELPAGEAMQHQTCRCDQSHLDDGQRGTADQSE